jgi:tetratricopeptide (TPR) repeat protein
MTTRFPLVASQLALDGGIALPELTTNASLTLLQHLAPTVVAHELQKAYDLVQAVGGLPLALKLMGNYLRAQSYSGQPRRIQSALKKLHDVNARLLLSEPPVAREAYPGLPAHASLSLQSIIALTDQHLPSTTREVLYALSVFPAKPHSFSEEAALAVAACSIEELDVLTDAGLLEGDSASRYTLHQTIADYAQLHLHDTAPRVQLIHYARTYVEAHKTDYELLEQESSMILAALHAAQVLMLWQDLLHIVFAFAPFFILRGNYLLAETYIQKAHEAAVALNDGEGMSRALSYLGELSYKQSNHAQAEVYFQDGLAQARRLGNLRLMSDLLQHLGRLYWRTGRLVQAEEYLQDGLVSAQQIDYHECITGLLSALGVVVASKGDYLQSIAYLEAGLVLARRIGDRERVCYLLLNLGVTMGELGRGSEAERYLQEGLLLARQIGYQEGVSLFLLSLGDLAMLAQNYAQSRIYLEEGLVVARRIGHVGWSCYLLHTLAEVAYFEGGYTSVEAYLQEISLLLPQLGAAIFIADYLGLCGRVALKQQRWESAEAAFQQMLASVPEGYLEFRALAQYGLAQVALAQGNLPQARALSDASRAVLKALGRLRWPEVNQWLESLEQSDTEANV